MSKSLAYLIMDSRKVPYEIFRARINRSQDSFSFDELGKPPVDKTIDGRANPKGISYFYAASNVETAISETRPYKTDTVYVAQFLITLKDEEKILDIRHPGKTLTPFEFEEESLEDLYVYHMSLLNHLSNLLSTPILPHKQDLEYLPTQYLCELAKDQGFIGIAFRSSLADGDNYVFFEDSVFTPKAIKIFRINNSKLDYEEIEYIIKDA